MKKFDYKSNYKKFKPKSKVKITFMDGKEEVTKKVRIISINAEGISFEDKQAVYECPSSKIKSIKKRSKISTLIILFIIFLVVSMVNFIYSYYKYGAVSAYGVISEQWMDKYGIGPGWDE